MVGVGALSACAGGGMPAAGPALPEAAAPGAAVAGPVVAGQPVPVTLDGAGYAAAIAPGAPGHRLTARGAAPVAGLTVTVTRQGAAIGNSEGWPAKQVAEAACHAGGRRFDGAALGRYAAPGAWVFAGACA